MYLHTHTMPGSRSDELGVLPPPELDTLLHYAKVLSDTKQRDHIDLMVMMLLSNDHVGKLLAIFEQCAQQNDLSNMRTLRGIFSTLLLWADTDMIQELVVDKHIHGVVSVFDFMSKRNPSFREQFENMPRFDLMDLLKKKPMLVENIQQSENLVFLKKQIAIQYQHRTQLVNALDQICRWKHLTIVNWMQHDTLILPQVFSMLKKNDDGGDNRMAMIDQKRSGLHFLSKVFEFALKDMQQFASSTFSREMAKKGLFDVIQQSFCVDDKDIQTTTSHLVYTITQIDSRGFQNHVLAQNEKHHHDRHHQHHRSDLVQVVLDSLVRVTDYGLKQQLFGIVKLMLNLFDTADSMKQPSSSHGPKSLFPGDDVVTGEMLKLFYERYASTLLLSIRTIETTQQQQQPTYMIDDALEPLELNPQQISYYCTICEYLESIILQHGNQTKTILQDKDSPCFQSIVQFLRCPDPVLKTKTVGFIRAAIGLRDDDVNELLVQQNVFAYLVRLLLNIYPQQQQQQQQQHHHHHHNNDKRLYRQLVELFDFIQLRNVFILLEHIVTEFGDLLEPIPVYQLIKIQYDKQLALQSSTTS